MADIKINDKVIELPIDSVVPHDGSHKTNEASVDALMQSIKDFGITQPISVDKNNVIVTGNGVYKAAKELGFETVPCIRVDYLTDEQIQQYRIADDKTSEFSTWNEKKLRKELSYLGDPNSIQFAFDESIVGMLGLNAKPKIPKITPVPSKDETNHTTKKVITEAQKDQKFKQELKGVEEAIQVKPSEYYEYHCSACGRLVKVKKP